MPNNLTTFKNEDRKKMIEMFVNDIYSIIPDNPKLNVDVKLDSNLINIEVSDGESTANTIIKFFGQKPNVFQSTWETDDCCFSDDMRWAGKINPNTFAKCQRICHGFENLSFTIVKDIKLLMSGKGFSPKKYQEFQSKY